MLRSGAGRGLGLPALLVICLALAVPVGGPAVANHVPASSSLLATATGPFSGYAQGVAVHVDALTLLAQNQRVANVDLGSSNAAVNSQGLAPPITNPYKRVVVPQLPVKHSYGLARVVEAGVAQAPDASGNLLPQALDPEGNSVEVSAPADQALSKLNLPIDIADLARVRVLRSEAAARWSDTSCIVGQPISQSQQYLARAQLIDQAANPSTPDLDRPLVGVDAPPSDAANAATHQIASESLYSPGPGADSFGLRSLVQGVLAPVRINLPGNEITIQVDGPASLDVRASGRPGGATVAVQAPLVTIRNNNAIVAQIPPLPSQLPNPIRIANGDQLIAEVSIGQFTTTTSPDGTSAKSVGDILRVRVLDIPNTITGFTLALGHMEAEAKVPAGGIRCPVPASKKATPESVLVGDSFTVTITVENPFDCDLVSVRVVDEIRTEAGARFRVVSTNPAANQVPAGDRLASGTVTWNDIGPIRAKDRKDVTVQVQAQDQPGGRFPAAILDIARVSATTANCPAGPGEAAAGVGVSGVSRELRVPVGSVQGELARTGAQGPLAVAGGLLLLLMAAAGAAVARRA